MEGLGLGIGIIIITAAVLGLRQLCQSTCIDCGRRVPDMCVCTATNSETQEVIGPLCMQCAKKITGG